MTDTALSGRMAVPRAAAPRPVATVARERPSLWLPVAMGAGIWIYFALPSEPAPWLGPALMLPPVAVWLTEPARRASFALLAVSAAWFAVALGFALADLAAWRAAAPVLPREVETTVEGRVVALTRAQAGAPRVLLDRVTLYGVEPGDTPSRVRVTLVGSAHATAPRPGQRVRVHARLSPPSGPVEPGAFDFRLRAWFEGLGAVGYARTPALAVPAAMPDGALDRAALGLARLRLRLADSLRAAIPGAEGAFAAAIITGDRSGIAPGDDEALRRSNLAHLLAISGLHMGILTGLVLAVARLGLSLVPGLERRVAAKKLAAVVALAAGAAYLALSGATVATQRAFVMVAVALVAVLIDRPAISLRALAVAAAVVLAIRPVSLLEVGFQMSFAATAVLIAGYEAMRGRFRRRRDGPWARRLARGVALWALGIAFTSLLAGLATAPYAAYHFNRSAPWGLVANLAAVPAMGLVIAPSAVLAGVLAPFGLAGPALAAMGEGIGWVLAVAHWVAGLPGAVGPVPATGPHVLALVTLGGLWLVLWRSRVRLLGVVPLAVALALWPMPGPRPDLVIAAEGRLLGLMTEEGRALDHPRAQAFAAETWLRRDGDLAEQAEAANRRGFDHRKGAASALMSNGWRVELIRVRRPDTRDLADLCRPRTLLIARHGPPVVEGPCRYLGWRDLRASVAVWIDADGLRLEVSGAGRSRPWQR